MHQKRGGYSYLIRPILIVLDVIILIVCAHYTMQTSYPLYGFLVLSWLLSAYLLNFYEVYRFTKVIKIVSLLVQQAVLMTILLFAFYGFNREYVSIKDTIRFFAFVFVIIGVIKLISYHALRKYRARLGGNNRHIIVIGNNESSQELQRFFKFKIDLGYKLLGVFGEKLPNTIEDSFSFLDNNNVDEIYCAIDEITDDQINKFVKYADENYCVLKFIPSSKRIISKRLKTDYYDYLPVLSIPEVSLNSSVNRAIKRAFDIVFSIFVIFFILSWLIPVLYFLIKLESSGPLIYSHRRNGINYKEFTCYKFRSMKHNSHENLDQVTRDDDRVTRIGKFIRRTSIDELPQFFNVFFGDMSVVGPRPHMLSYTKDYAKKIDKYNFVFRHSVRPGITGLAQVKGYRGEVQNDDDIINRIKYDIFYIENWSLLTDLKVILETIFNIIKGEDKAY